MLRFFIPDEYLPSIHWVDPARLGRRGIRGIILDLDNTLVEWNHPEPPEELLGWFAKVRQAGLRTCVVSNNSAARVQGFVHRLEIPGIDKAVKPRRGAFRRAMALMGTSPGETAVVGDQIFTDILGGKRLGLYTILVAPVTRREFIGTRLVRLVEGAFLRYLCRRGRIPVVALERAAPRKERRHGH